MAYFCKNVWWNFTEHPTYYICATLSQISYFVEKKGLYVLYVSSLCFKMCASNWNTKTPRGQGERNQNLSRHCRAFPISPFTGLSQPNPRWNSSLTESLLSGCRTNMDTLLQENPTGTFTAGAGTTCRPLMTGADCGMSQNRSTSSVWRENTPTPPTMGHGNYVIFQIGTTKHIMLVFDYWICWQY